MYGQSKQPSPTDAVRKRALSHPRRLEIFDHVAQARAGVDEAELAHAFDLPASRVRYHLAVLSSAGLIARLEDREPGTAGRYIAAA